MNQGGPIVRFFKKKNHKLVIVSRTRVWLRERLSWSPIGGGRGGAKNGKLVMTSWINNWQTYEHYFCLAPKRTSYPDTKVPRVSRFTYFNVAISPA